MLSNYKPAQPDLSAREVTWARKTPSFNNVATAQGLLKTWKFTVTEHSIVTSFEGKRARTRSPWAINKLSRFKYLSVWADDHLLLLLLSFISESVNSRISAAILSYAWSMAHCSLTVAFPWMPTPSFGVLSAVQSQFQSLGSVRGSQVCRKFERIKVKILSLQIRAWVPHSKHTKPFWKRWLLERSCNVQTAMNLSMFDQEFQPGLLAKEYANVCPALKQRKKHLVIAHSQQKWLWKCSPLSWGAALRSEGSREHREGAKMDCWILVLCCHEPSPTSATLERLFPLALLPMLDVAQVSP